MKQTKKIRLLIAAAALAVLAALVLGWALSPVGPLADDRGEIRNIIVMIPDGGGFGSFDMAEAVKRAGLDYWHLVEVFDYENLADFFSKNDVKQMWCLSTKAPRSYTEAVFEDNCYLFFGKETKGLPEDFLEEHRQCCVRLPMRDVARSLNLSNSVAITVYEALRQLNFPGLLDHGKMGD